MCTSNKLPGAADAVGLGITFENSSFTLLEKLLLKISKLTWL